MALTQQDMDIIRTTAGLTVEQALERFRDVAKEQADVAVKLHAAECPTKQQYFQDRNRIVGMIIAASCLGGAVVTGIGWVVRLW